MAAVYLHGHLADIYGERFDLDVSSVAEALRLLAANFPTFPADISKHNPGFYIRIGDESAASFAELTETWLEPEIHIVPAITGAGGNNNGVGQIVLAAALFVAAYYGGFSPSTTSTLYGASLNLAISGVSTLLFSSKVSTNGELQDVINETDKASYAFAGPVNTTSQGNPVPVLYGRLLVGSQVISAGITAQ